MITEESTRLKKKKKKNPKLKKKKTQPLTEGDHEGDHNYKYILDENKNKIKMTQISSRWGTRGTGLEKIEFRATYCPRKIGQ